LPKKRASTDAARLSVLAAGDEQRFAEFVDELLRSGDRLSRESALESLVGRPVPSLRDEARALYVSLDANGPKLDQGARQRTAIARYLLALGDVRDADIAALACERREIVMGDDTTCELRVTGMQLMAKLQPDLLPFYAVERLGDVDAPDCASRDDGEPAATAIRLLAGFGQFPALYAWLRGEGASSHNLLRAFEAFQDAPPVVFRRFVGETVQTAIARNDERLCIAIAESVVNQEIESSYPQIAAMMSAKISDDLYHYLAVLLASTNRSALLDILREQLRRGRRPRLVVEALRVRTTPEQAEMLRRWEDGELGEES
jgi:hypothetical protein